MRFPYRDEPPGCISRAPDPGDPSSRGYHPRASPDWPQPPVATISPRVFALARSFHSQRRF